jgi:hypothetical protein
MAHTAFGLWQREANYLDIPKALVKVEGKGRKGKEFTSPIYRKMLRNEGRGRKEVS